MRENHALHCRIVLVVFCFKLQELSVCLSVSGNYETYTLSHPSWWDRLQPWWPSGAGALTFLCVPKEYNSHLSCCSHLLCTSCCCPGRTIHKVRWDVGDILKPWRAHIGRQCPCAGAAAPPRQGQELHVLLLSCTCSGAFWVVGVCHLPCCFWWMFMNLGSLVTSVVTWHRVAWCP